MTIELDVEETLELIMFHGHSLGDPCPHCGQPIKEQLLIRIERMRELILTLPDHVMEVVFEPDERTQH